MATISSLGVGSGLDIESLITKLMAVEKAPLTALDTKETTYNAKISALGALKSAISALQTAAGGFVPDIGENAQTNFATYSSTIADTTVGTATADSGASASVGDYSLKVIQTARNDRLTFAASPTLTAGTTLSIAVGSGTAVDIPITSGMTLAGLRDAINDASGGVSATIIGGTQLVLTSDTSGADNLITVSGTAGFSWNPATGTGTNITQSADNKGRNAQIELNGITLTSTTNTFADAIDGVDITLKSGAVANTTTTLTVAADTSTKVADTVKAFVAAYNEFVAQVKKYGYYDASTKTAGTLQGDYTLRTTQNELYQLLTKTPTGVTGTVTSLSNLGVSIQRDGTLAIDSTKLSNAASSNYQDVTDYLAALGGAIDSAADDMLGSDGIFANATDTLNSKIEDLDKRREALEYRLTQIEARYRSQFAALDTLISSMTATSDYLTQQLDALSSLISKK
jgi:flagellar hook-associated protein 2